MNDSSFEELRQLLKAKTAELPPSRIPLPPKGRCSYPKCFHEFHYLRNRADNVGKRCPGCGFEMTAEKV